jgi:predicted GNAT superfamily acetyltransferase
MLILFDHGVPAPLVPYLIDHTVVKARDRGWDRLSNGDLLAEAERAGFDVFLTADKNIQYQQNLADRKIASLTMSAVSSSF